MTDRWLIFKPAIQGYMIGIMLCFAIIFVWFEYKKTTSFFIPRMLAVVLLLASLALIFMVPSYKTLQSSTIILLTPAYDQATADSLLTVKPNAVLLHTENTKAYRNSKAINSPQQLSRRNVSYILGQGLPAGALDLIEPGTYHFLPTAYPTGIIHLGISSSVYVNRNNVIEGVYHKAVQNEKIVLQGPGGREDSMVFSGKRFEQFKLAFLPKQSGNFLYTIIVGNNRERFPVHVQDLRQLNILFIQEYPTFESRELKTFLGRNHRLLLRYRLSRNKYRYEYVNRTSQTLQSLNRETLSSFDLLMIDTDALQTLSSAEVKTLQNEINNGLGILILFNDLPFAVNRVKTFLPLSFRKVNNDTAQFRIRTKKFTLPVWRVDPAADIALTSTLRNKNRILSGYCNVGLGKAGFQLLQQTYQLALKGDSASYSEIWSDLIGKTARSVPNTFSLQSDKMFPVFPDEPHYVKITSAGTRPTLLNDNVRISLSEDIYIDDAWSGKLWFGTPGWHELKIPEDNTTLPYYVFKKGEWESLSIANQIENTFLNSNALPIEKEKRSAYIPVPQWIFYLLFLVSAGFLWLAPKF